MLVLALAGGCGAQAHAPTTNVSSHGGSPAQRWVVIAPHPDDEALIAAGLLFRAAQEGAAPDVIVVTNGDLDCEHDGLRREAESVAGLRALGIDEAHVHFLGYPDGALAELGRVPLPPRRRRIGGACTLGAVTYGARGRGGRDHHTARTGAPAAYTRANAVGDLAAILDELRPSDVAITHPADTHPDHAATYALFRQALDRLGWAPRVHRAIVHNGDCWPTGDAPHEPCPVAEVDPTTPTPPLTGRLAGYFARERFVVADGCLDRDPARNPKLRAIAAHASQTRGDLTSYLFAFARSDEAFFPETLTRTPTRWRGWRRSEAEGAVAASTVIPIAGPRPRTLQWMHAPLDGYELSIEDGRATLRRVREDGARVLRSWPLPHDLWSSTSDAGAVSDAALTETFELSFDPRPDDGAVGTVAEVSVRVRGELSAVVIDLAPSRPVGPAIDLSASPSARPGR